MWLYQYQLWHNLHECGCKVLREPEVPLYQRWWRQRFICHADVKRLGAVAVQNAWIYLSLIVQVDRICVQFPLQYMLCLTGVSDKKMVSPFCRSISSCHLSLPQSMLLFPYCPWYRQRQTDAVTAPEIDHTMR